MPYRLVLGDCRFDREPGANLSDCNPQICSTDRLLGLGTLYHIKIFLSRRDFETWTKAALLLAEEALCYCRYATRKSLKRWCITCLQNPGNYQVRMCYRTSRKSSSSDPSVPGFDHSIGLDACYLRFLFSSTVVLTRTFDPVRFRNSFWPFTIITLTEVMAPLPPNLIL